MASKNVLVGGQNAKLNGWLSSVLRSAGFANIVVVHDTQRLFKEAAEAHFSIIIIDDDGQHFRSVDIALRIKAAAGRPVNNIIILVDGTSHDVIDAVKYQGIALAGILLKPFEAAALQKILARPSKNIIDDAPAKLLPPTETNKVLINAKLFTAKVIDCDIFVGLSFMGRLLYGDAPMIKKAFYKAYSIDKPVMIAINLSDVSEFDEGFLGLLLQFNGMVAARGRYIVLIIGAAKVARRFESLGLGKVLKTYPTTSDFYTEVGYFSS